MLSFFRKKIDKNSETSRLAEVDFVDAPPEIKGVIDKLHEVDRSCQHQKASILLFRWVPWLLAGVIAAFILDVVLHLESNARVLFVGLGLAVLLGIFITGFYLCFLRRSSLENIARFIEAQDPSLGSKFINMLQLEQQVRDSSLQKVTREMAQLAQCDYAQNLTEKNIQVLAKIYGLKKHLKLAIISALAFLILLGLFYRISVIEFARYLDPYGDHPPFSFTQLNISDPGPQAKEVIYGKSCLVKATYSGHKPTEVFISYYPVNRPDSVHTIPLFTDGEVGYFQQIENIRSNLVIFAHTKKHASISRKRHITVILTPQLEKSYIQVIPPQYTGLKIEEKSYDFGNLKVLKGTGLRYRLQSNRPLEHGIMDIIPIDGSSAKVNMKPSAAQEVTGEILADKSARIRFSLVDQQGIASQDNWEGSLTLMQDMPPDIAFRSPERDCFVAVDYALRIQLEAADDYGLKQVRFHLGKNGVFTPPSTTNYPSFTRHAQENYPIDFRQLEVKPGDTLTCFAEAIDNSLDSSVSTTPTLHIKIISVEDFNQFARENTDFSDLLGKYGQVMDQLREQIEKQIKLRDQAESLQKQTNGQPVQAEWEKLLSQQTELNKSLQEFSSSINQLIRDQPVYDIEKEWNKTLKELAQTIKASADTNAAELTALAPNPGQAMMKSLDAFKQSAERQLTSLGVPEKEMQDKVIDTAEQLSLLHELMKDFTAYEQMFKAQGNITDQSKAFNRPGALPREDQLSLKNMAGLEHEIEQGLESLAQKLREDAKEAEAQFPKAASSARTMADKMEQLRLSYLASQTTESMLAAQGQQSNQRAERLRAEMESLCSDCQGGEGDSANEADGYLKAQKNLNPGKTLQQMKFSQKFGNKPGVGKGQGKGQGEGQDGGTLAEANRFDVFGNESLIQQSLPYRKGNRQAMPGTSIAENSSNPEARKDRRRGMDPVRHSAEATSSDSVSEEYRNIVDQYFRAIVK